MPDATIKVLLVAYHFPPLGLGGVGRALALFKYLGQFGVRVLVLTVKDIVYPEYDHSLLKGLDLSCVMRSGSCDPSRLMRLVGVRKRFRSDMGDFSAGILCRPDYKRGWNWFAYHKACSTIKNHGIDCIITTSPPPSSHLIGLKLRDKYRLPWIADFRDLWYSLPIEKVYKYQGQIEYARKLKQSVVDTADEIVGVNKSILSYLGRGELIYNAADDGVIDFWKNEPQTGEDNFHIGILGSISRLTPIEPLFKILRAVIDKDGGLKNKIKIIHAGKCSTGKVMAAACKYGLANNIKLNGYLPKQTAIQSLAGSNLLYIAVQDIENYHILPGRIFDMLVSGKPILAVAHPDSDLAEIAGSHPTNIVVDYDDIDMAGKRLASLIDNPGEFSESGDVRQYTASVMARKYADVIRHVIENK
jgi:glycosyltransferase involved in cell wall biosynthesis